MFDRMEARYYKILARTKRKLKQKEKRKIIRLNEKMEKLFGKDWKMIDKKERRNLLEKVCQKSEYQNPCKPDQEMHCMKNRKGRLSVLKCEIFHQAWGLPRDPLMTSHASLSISPLGFHASSSLSSSFPLLSSSSYLSLSSDKCLCKKPVKRKKRYFEMKNDGTEVASRLKKRRNAFDGNMNLKKKLMKNGVETSTEIPCVLKFKGEDTYINPSELFKRRLNESDSDVIENDYGDKMNVASTNKVDSEKNDKGTDAKINFLESGDKVEFANNHFNENINLKQNGKNKNMIIEKELFQIVCKPHVYSNKKQWREHKKRIHDIVDSYKLKLAGLRQIRSRLKEFKPLKKSLNKSSKKIDKHSEFKTKTNLETPVLKNEKIHQTIKPDFLFLDQNRPSETAALVNVGNNKNLENIGKKVFQTLPTTNGPTLSTTCNNNGCDSKETNNPDTNNAYYSPSTKELKEQNLIKTTGYIYDKQEIEEDGRSESDHHSNSFYDYLDVFDGNGDYDSTENIEFDSDNQYYEVIECACDDEDVIKINGNTFDFDSVNASFSENSVKNFYFNSSKNSEKNISKSRNYDFTFINPDRVYKNNYVEHDENQKDDLSHKYFENHSISNNMTFSNRNYKNKSLKGNYYDDNYNLDYTLWHRRNNRREMKRIKVDMEKNIENAMVGNRRNRLMRLYNLKNNFKLRNFKIKNFNKNQKKRKFNLYKFSARNDPKCNIAGLECFRMDRDHWKVEPKWEDEPICSCINANNNTYWCMRTINETHNFLFCEFITGFMSYYDINKDPHQLRNAIEDIPFEALHEYHKQLKFLKNCRGSKECNAVNNPDNYYNYKNLNKKESEEYDDEDDEEENENVNEFDFENIRKSYDFESDDIDMYD